MNPRMPSDINGFQDRRIKPLCHPSGSLSAGQVTAKRLPLSRRGVLSGAIRAGGLTEGGAGSLRRMPTMFAQGAGRVGLPAPFRARPFLPGSLCLFEEAGKLGGTVCLWERAAALEVCRLAGGVLLEQTVLWGRLRD